MAENNAVGEQIDSKDTRRFIKLSLERISAKHLEIDLYNRYYDGNHPLNFKSEKYRNEYGKRLQKFRDNLCPICVEAPAERLEVIGFSSDKNSKIYTDSWNLWLYSHMPRIAVDVHEDVFRTGDGYVVVWNDTKGRARIWHQDVRNCTVWHDPETGEVESGVKVWRGLDNYVYMTVYYRDRIEKYITLNKQASGNVPTTAAAFVKRNVEGEDWPLLNRTGVCPMFHFQRKASILKDVIPLNDALNKTLCDMLVGSEANSLLQRWTTGLQYEVDPQTGNQIIPFEQSSPWFAASSTEAKFGEFGQVALGDFLASAEDFRNEIATVTGIPQYYFRLDGGSMPSGEALRKAESRFTSLIKKSQVSFGETWSNAMKFAMIIDLTPSALETDQIEAQWTPADPMSANEAVDLALKKESAGVSQRQALSEIGYSDAQLKQMETENQDAADKKAETFTKSFNAGQIPA